MTRKDSRRDYRNFPSAYAELFMSFASSKETKTLGPFDTEKAARAAARDLYRYRGFLRAAIEDDNSDDFARRVHDLARDVKIEISVKYPAALPTDGCLDLPQHWLTLSVNPLVSAVFSALRPKPTDTIIAIAPDPRDPDPSRAGIFAHHNCWKCGNGVTACAEGNPAQCSYPHARND